MIVLKPCPFCGGEAQFYWPSLSVCEVGCAHCDVVNPGMEHDEEGAARMWNTRGGDEPLYTLTDAGRALIAGTD